MPLVHIYGQAQGNVSGIGTQRTFFQKGNINLGHYFIIESGMQKFVLKLEVNSNIKNQEINCKLERIILLM